MAAPAITAQGPYFSRKSTPDDIGIVIARESPGVHAGALLRAARRRGSDRLERAHDPFARVRRIDHVVDLEMRRGVDRLAALVGPPDHLLEHLLALGGVGDRRELVPESELDCTFE